MFTQTYINTISKSLEVAGTFKRSDFKLDVSEEKVGGATRIRLEIKYLFEPRYSFLALVPLSVSVQSPISVKFSPGQMFQTEEITLSIRNELLDTISSWLQRMRNEIRSLPILREMELQQQQIEEMLAQLSDIPNEFFSREEGEFLKVKLEELEARLTDNLKTAGENEKKVAASVLEIRKDIDGLKDNIASMGKKSWAGALMVRTFEWMKNPANRKVLKSGAQVARDLLVEAGEHITDGK